MPSSSLGSSMSEIGCCFDSTRRRYPIRISAGSAARAGSVASNVARRVRTSASFGGREVKRESLIGSALASTKSSPQPSRFPSNPVPCRGRRDATMLKAILAFFMAPVMQNERLLPREKRGMSGGASRAKSVKGRAPFLRPLRALSRKRCLALARRMRALGCPHASCPSSDLFEDQCGHARLSSLDSNLAPPSKADAGPSPGMTRRVAPWHRLARRAREKAAPSTRTLRSRQHAGRGRDCGPCRDCALA